MDGTESDNTSVVEIATELTAAYVSRNSVPVAELPKLIRSIHDTLSSIGQPRSAEAPVEALKPAVPIKKSVTDEYIVSLEDGRKFKSLKRHLATSHGMTPAEYRAKWGLLPDYPMVAPAYAARRSALAKTIGLGRKAAASTPAPLPEPVQEPEATAPKPKRACKKRACKKAG